VAIPLSAEKKAKKADGIVAERSCRFFVLFYRQINSIEEGYRFLPFCSLSRRAGERQNNPGNPVDPV
jgi:hypothetical protein